MDIATAVKPGANTLEAAVANSRHNRLAGDAALPVEQRCASVTAATVKPDAPLQSVGLLGPVTVQTAEIIPKN